MGDALLRPVEAERTTASHSLLTERVSRAIPFRITVDGAKNAKSAVENQYGLVLWGCRRARSRRCMARITPSRARCGTCGRSKDLRVPSLAVEHISRPGIKVYLALRASCSSSGNIR